MDGKKDVFTCPICQRGTYCKVLRFIERVVGLPSLPGKEKCSIIECGGCATIFYMTETFGHPTSKPEDSYACKIYPERIWRHINTKLDFFDPTNTEINDLESEINAAISSRLFRLAAMGIRTLVMLIVNKAREQSFDTFSACTNFLHTNGDITEKQKLALDQCIELGGSAVHRGHIPTAEQILAAAEIVGIFSPLLLRADKAAGVIESKLPPHTRRQKTNS